MKKDNNIKWRHVDAASLDLKGWKVAVVGGTGGLGRAIGSVLASRGARVTVVGQTFRDSGVAGIEFVKADLSLMREAERAAQALPAEQLDLVVLTTGIFAAPQRQETAEGIERDKVGKPQAGKLVLRAETSESELVFEVTDDGRGIDWALIAEKAKQRGLPHLTQADLTAALCADGVSTLDQVSELSGRDIGMAAVKSRIQALHGSLEVRSTKGVGTTWLIRFPMFAPRATETAA